ncbi:callose synthase 1 [Quercus suber]|uniref:Callose synthase 1 n=1 Tax=Quercus suber TaxID=58331 RepID=A0AAW0IV89_QUESU
MDALMSQTHILAPTKVWILGNGCINLTVLTVYVFLYGRLYLILSGLEKELSTNRDLQNKLLKEALASQPFVQIGFLLYLPFANDDAN